MVFTTNKAIIVLPVFLLLMSAMILIVPVANADDWSSSNPGINYWIDPNIVENARTVHHAGTSYSVQAVQYGWETTQAFYFHIKNDNYCTASTNNLKLMINGIVQGPVPFSNWSANYWVAYNLWDASTSSWTYAGASDGILFSDVDNNESFIGRVAFNFSNPTVYSAGSWFPGNVKVQMKLYNTDNAEVYWTPTLDWWVWDYALENAYKTAVADTYIVSSGGTFKGSDNNLLACYNFAGGEHYNPYFKFPLAVSPNWGIQRAWLKMYNEGAATTLTLSDVMSTGSSWGENQLCGDNAGAIAPLESYLIVDMDIGVGWNYFEVSDIVREGAENGDTYFSVMVFNGTGAVVKFRSKEYADSTYWPQLIIETAPMGAATPPTFNIDSVTTSDFVPPVYYPRYYNLLLRGFVENMGDDVSANFTFYTYNEDGSLKASYPYPSAMTVPGYFSVTTTGYEYEEDTSYYMRIQCHGNSTQTWTWAPADGYYYFRIHENTVFISTDTENFREPCTLTNTTVDGITAHTANLHYNLIVGANNLITITFDLAENANNLDNYMTTGHISYTWSATSYSWSNFYVYDGLENGKTYYVRARGIDADLNPVWDGRWITFTTLIRDIITEPPFDFIGLFTAFTGGDRTMAGYMVGAFFLLIPLTIVGLAVVAAAKAKEHSALVILMFYMTGLFLCTVTSLFPWWFLTFHIAVIALYFARGWIGSRGG